MNENEKEKYYEELLDIISMNYEFILSSRKIFDEKIKQFNKDNKEFEDGNIKKTKDNIEKMYTPFKEFFNDIQKKSEICNKKFEEFSDFVIKDIIKKHNIKE